jgi:hypothetical protein
MVKSSEVVQFFDHSHFNVYISNQIVSEARNCIANASAEYLIIRNSNRINYFCIPINEIALCIHTIAKYCSALDSNELFWSPTYDEKLFRQVGKSLRAKLPNLDDCPVLLTIWGVQSKSVFLMLKTLCSWLNSEVLTNERVLSLESINRASRRLQDDAA